MTTCAQAIQEVFISKDQILTAKQIIDAVEGKYQGKWKEITIRTHTMGYCQVQICPRPYIFCFFPSSSIRFSV